MYLTRNQLSRNELCCTEDNHGYMSSVCAKEYLDSN